MPPKKKEEFSMKIEKIESSKHNIKQRALMKANVIPQHPSISLFSGSQGGGKTTLVANLLTKPHMYGKSMENTSNDEEQKKPIKQIPKPYFDAIFLFIGSDDDMYDSLIDNGTINKDHVVHMPQPSDIQKVIDQQKSLLAKVNGDITKVPKILVIFDDIINDKKLINSKPFLEMFVKGRHLNSSSWLLCQYLNLCPRACRLQANYLFVFKCNRLEMQVLYEQYCPPDMNKSQFFDMVMDATKDTDDQKNNFLMIVKRAPIEQRFRQNLDHFITMDKYEEPELDTKDIMKDLKKSRKKKKDTSLSDDEKDVKELPVRTNNIKEHTSVLPMHETPKLVLDRSTLIRLNGGRRP